MDSSSSTSSCDPPEKMHLCVDLSVGCSPCTEALLSLAAGSVLSVLQCPPPSPLFRASPLLCSPKCSCCCSTASVATAMTIGATATAASASLPTSPASMTTTAPDTAATRMTLSGEQRPHLIHFLRNICVRAAVTELALVISLIYVDRLKKVLSNMARGDPDTPFKIILSALLVVKKFIEEDCVGLNRMFSKITDGLYSVHDINTMERSFLGLLKFSLYVTDKDVIEYVQSHQTELQGVDLLKSLSNPAMAA